MPLSLNAGSFFSKFKGGVQLKKDDDQYDLFMQPFFASCFVSCFLSFALAIVFFDIYQI